MKTNFAHLLLGKDLLKLKNSRKAIDAVQDQETFDELFGLLFHHERPLVLRAADTVEKITDKHREYLEPHKTQLLSILKSADHKELKWHLAQLIPRIRLSRKELEEVWHILTYQSLNPNENKIVRINSLQGLYNLSREFPDLKEDFEKTMYTLEHEQAPSIQARIKKLKNII